jgi:hypothetical protein
MAELLVPLTEEKTSVLHLTYLTDYPKWSSSPKIFLDGIEVGKIKKDETLSFPIAPGEHRIEAKSFWGQGSEIQLFEIKSNEALSLRLVSGVPALYVTFLKYWFLSLVPTYFLQKAALLGLISKQLAHTIDPHSLIWLILYFKIFRQKDANGMKVLKKILYFETTEETTSLERINSPKGKLFRDLATILCFTPLIMTFFFKSYLISFYKGFWAPEITLIYYALIFWVLVRSRNIIPKSSQ